MGPNPPIETYRNRIGERVTVAFGGRTVEGVIRDADHFYLDGAIVPQLKIARRGGVTISVSPEAIHSR